MKFIKRQILDSREEQLVNKAGMEAFSFLMTSNLIFYIGSIFIHLGKVYTQLFLFSSLIAFLYFLERCRRLEANYFNSFTFTIWGGYGNDGFGDGCDFGAEFSNQSYCLSE